MSAPSQEELQQVLSSRRHQLDDLNQQLQENSEACQLLLRRIMHNRERYAQEEDELLNQLEEISTGTTTAATAHLPA